MASEHAAIRVQLIDHDVLQIFKQPRPPGVVRQDPRVQHVGIGQDNVPLLPNRLPRIARRVPVIGKHRKSFIRGFRRLRFRISALPTSDSGHTIPPTDPAPVPSSETNTAPAHLHSSRWRQSLAGCSRVSSLTPSASQSPHFSRRVPLPQPRPDANTAALSPSSDTRRATARSPTPAIPYTPPPAQGTVAPP